MVSVFKVVFQVYWTCDAIFGVLDITVLRLTLPPPINDRQGNQASKGAMDGDGSFGDQSDNSIVEE